MPFKEVSAMHLRRQMVLSIRAGEMNISEAARSFGVSRNTVKLWLRRSEGAEISELCELSRRPHRFVRTADPSIVEQVLEYKQRKPKKGAKKIVSEIWPLGEAPVSVRTVDRVLKRHDLVNVRSASPVKIGRFERDYPNELWQMDFKGMGEPWIYSPLTVLDDASRFVHAFEPLPNHQTQTIWEALWNVFGDFGMPLTILSDNESCFADVKTKGLSRLEANLLLLGIRMSHGRARHPQTQGKVERFHGTVKEELGAILWQESIEEARAAFSAYVQEYNYDRSHEALGMRRPGQVYNPSIFKRPDTLPKHEIEPGRITRKVDIAGKFSFNGQCYRAGRGLSGEYVEIREVQGEHWLVFANYEFAMLSTMKA
jgi:transposase InsO family protein